MTMELSEIKKDWDPETRYDITDIKDKERWEYYFTKLFPGHEFTIYWVGKLEEDPRLLFMPRTEEHFKMFLLHRTMFTFSYKNGRIEMFITNSPSTESREKIEKIFMKKEPKAIWDFLAAVYGPGDEKGMSTVEFVPKTFQELDVIKARDFTDEERTAIDNAETKRQIDEKMKEIEVLKAKIVKI